MSFAEAMQPKDTVLGYERINDSDRKLNISGNHPGRTASNLLSPNNEDDSDDEQLLEQESHKVAADESEKAYRELRLQKLLAKTDKIVSKLSQMMKAVVATSQQSVIGPQQSTSCDKRATTEIAAADTGKRPSSSTNRSDVLSGEKADVQSIHRVPTVPIDGLSSAVDRNVNSAVATQDGMTGLQTAAVTSDTTKSIIEQVEVNNVDGSHFDNSLLNSEGQTVAFDISKANSSRNNSTCTTTSDSCRSANNTTVELATSKPPHTAENFNHNAAEDKDTASASTMTGSTISTTDPGDSNLGVGRQQPAMLQGVQLREYQVGGVEWLMSLHASGLNGILAGMIDTVTVHTNDIKQSEQSEVRVE
jgi:hypothetical protein